MNNKSIVLIEVIIIVVLLAIIALGIATYVTEGLRYNISNINQDKALYMAQAGIMSALVDYLDDGLFSPQANVNVNSPSEFYYSVGDQGSFLLIDSSDCKANGRVVNTWPIKNISPATTLTITSIKIEWNFVAKLNSMKIGNRYILKNSSLSNPATINSSNCYQGSIPLMIPGNTNYSGTNDQYIQFSVNVPPSITVAVTFNFSDGSSSKKYLVIDGQVTNNEFSLKATGKIQGGAEIETRRRTIVATYDVDTNRITSWEESQNHIMP